MNVEMRKEMVQSGNGKTCRVRHLREKMKWTGRQDPGQKEAQVPGGRGDRILLAPRVHLQNSFTNEASEVLLNLSALPPMKLKRRLLSITA